MNDIKPHIEHTRAHLYEIDLIRAITVFSVVSIHSFAFTKFLITNPSHLLAFNLLGHILHFNREMFMFVTAFVLTYVYYNRQISLKNFYLKRVLVVFIPYVLWSIIYILLNFPGLGFTAFIQKLISSIITGKASFQLYYILLTLQFYAIFPFFLFFLRKVSHRPWEILTICFVAQILFLFYDFTYLQSGIHKVPEVLKTLYLYRDRIFFEYQFFFIFGALAAVYIDQARNALFRYSRYILMLLLTTLSLYVLYSNIQVVVFQAPINRAVSVLQPSVVVYSIVVIIFFMWVAIRWAKKRNFYNLIHVISNTSFGIFFVHVFVLEFTRQFILPLLPQVVPIPLKILFVLLTAFTSSVLISYLLLKTPLLSWTIGKTRK